MTAVRRIVVIGAFSGIAAAAVAGSGGFACTSLASLTATYPGQTDVLYSVHPGDVVVIEAARFWDPTNADGTKVGAIEMTLHSPFTGVAPITVASGPGFTQRVEFAIDAPLSSQARDSQGNPVPYQVIARQKDTDGKPIGSALANLYVVARPAPSGGQPSGGQPSEDQPPAPAGGGTSVTIPDRLSAPDPVAVRPAPSQVFLAPAGPAAAAPGASAPAQAVAPVPSQPAVAAAPLAPDPAVPVVVGQPGADTPRQVQLAANDLWSGLSADGTPSLLDSTQPTRQSGIPAGGLLLGTGLVALAGIALAASGRRLALPTR